MFRLTREVRFGIDDPCARTPIATGLNGYGGSPPLTGPGGFFQLRVTLASAAIDPDSNYLRDIKEIDRIVRDRAIPIIARHLRRGTEGLRPATDDLAGSLFVALKDGWPPASLEGISLLLSPYLSLSVNAREFPMTRLSQKFEFSAAHRLHNPTLSDTDNQRIYGKCNNPHLHGHNYELQVTVAGQPNENGQIIDVRQLERIVTAAVIDRFDHKNLNVETAEFRELIPTVENIACVIYRLLSPQLRSTNARLASVIVWETPKTWCEYSEHES